MNTHNVVLLKESAVLSGQLPLNSKSSMRLSLGKERHLTYDTFTGSPVSFKILYR